MIKVNLLPGGGRKSGRARLSIGVPKIRTDILKQDRWVTGSAITVLAALTGCAFFFFSVGGDREELEVQVEMAVRDSIQFADVIAQAGLLQARADSIAQRVAVIQEIDQGRYVWPHLMDEIARAMPDYAWLTQVFQTSIDDLPSFQVQGRAGTYFALTSLMENLEASPFIEGVQLVASDQIALTDEDGGGDRLLYEFILEATAELPPPELIETLPLFGPSVTAPATGQEG